MLNLKTLIVTGGSINIDFLQEHLTNNNYNSIIASDKGLEMLDKCGIKPNCIIGDFDSINKNILDKYVNDNQIEIVELNPEKDFTDTHMAIKHAIKNKATEITIVGATGTRIDHMIANIHVLKEAMEKEIICKILNENNEIRLINKNTIIENDPKYKYVSLIPLTTTVEGITLKGFKYSLADAQLKIGQSIGVSNEQIAPKAEIILKKGILILIKSRD